MIRGAALALLVSGCGYAVVGSRTLFQAHTIAVKPFMEAQPLGLSPDLCQELASLLAGGGVQLAFSEQSADGVLSGEIHNVTNGAYSANGRIVSYHVAAIIDARLTVHGKQVWKTSLPVGDDFLPAPSDAATLTRTLTTEADRREALVRIASAAARALHEQLVEAGGT